MSLKYIHSCKSHANFFFAGYGITNKRATFIIDNRQKNTKEEKKVSGCFLNGMKHGNRQNSQRL